MSSNLYRIWMHALSAPRFFMKHRLGGHTYNLNVTHSFPKSWNTPSDTRSLAPGVLLIALTISSCFDVNDSSGPNFQVSSTSLEESSSDNLYSSAVTVLNWSGTHQVDVPTQFYFEPSSEEEVVSILSRCHEKNQPVRPVGSALSPNGLSFQPQGMISLANLDSILEITRTSPETALVRVQAGAKVSHLLHVLREYGWTLPNLASIAEQQLGGFVQVSAHGTGATIPPVDDFVVGMKLATPAKGVVHLSLEQDPDLFHLAKVGLGCLGVVTELTLQCIPVHNLVEHTFVLTRNDAKTQIHTLLKQHRHVRYMWIPYEDAVVVVTNDSESMIQGQGKLGEVSSEKIDTHKRFEPFIELMQQLRIIDLDENLVSSASSMSFGDMRDRLIAYDPLNESHIRRVNKAEAEFWRRSEGYQTKPSDQLLQFDCGGQQWVKEICFPTGTLDENDGSDIEFMDTLLREIETRGIPAHAPIEQRWTCSSSSRMSPAHGSVRTLFSWIGIIMYLPLSESEKDEQLRQDITYNFKGEYCNLLQEIGYKYNAVSHWAKLEVPNSIADLIQLKHSLGKKYPLDEFNALRLEYDPKNILGNNLLNLVLGTPGSKDAWKPRS